MIITRTPFRISFIGGGTDLKDHYSKYGGCVVSATIAKYIYITYHTRLDDMIQLKYAINEIESNPRLLTHDIARVILSMFNISGVDIDSISDVPAKAGLGSSSAYTVGLLNAIHCGYMPQSSLAELACKVEIDILNKPIGKQDQYAVATGGLNFIEFYEDESVDVSPVYLFSMKETLIKHLMLFYMGESGDQRAILSKVRVDLSNSLKHDILKEMSELATRLRDNFLRDMYCLPEILNKGWELKKTLSLDVTNPSIDHYISLGLNSGALGGKLLGSGGGGCLLFFCPPEEQIRVRTALIDLKEIPLNHFDESGSVVIYKD